MTEKQLDLLIAVTKAALNPPLTQKDSKLLQKLLKEVEQEDRMRVIINGFTPE